MNDVSPTTPLHAAVAAAGSQSALARRIGCTPQHVSLMVGGMRRVSGEVALLIEREGLGVTARDLRPDLFRSTEAA